ncbi:MAG: pyridoxamine 5'-phosphate oxidase family protein [Bryobacteraceae bacterium]
MDPRTTLRMHPERARPDRAHEFLAAGMVAHLGFAVQQNPDEPPQPYVIPLTYHFDADEPDLLYLHGGTRSRAMDHLATGAPVCVTVTMLDGLVYAKTALHHSMNYRCVVVFGRAAIVEEDARKAEVLEKMISRYWPDRIAGRDYSSPPEGHLKITALAEIRIESMSAKLREGGPNGPGDNDPDAPGTAGVTPLQMF